MRKAVSSFVRAQVEASHDTGFNQVHTSKQLNIYRCCVQSVINKYNCLSTYDDSKRSGRPKERDVRGFRHLERLINGDACLSATKIASNLNTCLPKPVITPTVCTCLKELAFK